MAESCLSAEKNFPDSEVFAVLLLLAILAVLILLVLLVLLILILLVLILLILILLVPVLLILILVVHDLFYRMFGCLSKIFVKCRFFAGNAPKTRRLTILHRRCAGIHRKYQSTL